MRGRHPSGKSSPCHMSIFFRNLLCFSFEWSVRKRTWVHWGPFITTALCSSDTPTPTLSNYMFLSPTKDKTVQYKTTRRKYLKNCVEKIKLLKHLECLPMYEVTSCNLITVFAICKIALCPLNVTQTGRPRKASPAETGIVYICFRNMRADSFVDHICYCFLFHFKKFVQQLPPSCLPPQRPLMTSQLSTLVEPANTLHSYDPSVIG
jgi:hypothetical protein